MDRRKPYSERRITDLDDNDMFVSVSGYVISKKEDYFVMDDGTGTIPIIGNFEVEQNKYVRAFGTLLNMDNKLQLQADIVQDLSKIDTFLYNKIKSLL